MQLNGMDYIISVAVLEGEVHQGIDLVIMFL